MAQPSKPANATRILKPGAWFKQTAVASSTIDGRADAEREVVGDVITGTTLDVSDKPPCTEDLSAVVEQAGALRQQYQETWALDNVETRVHSLRSALAAHCRPELDISTISSSLLAAEALKEMSNNTPLWTYSVFELALALADRYIHGRKLQDLDNQVDLLRDTLKELQGKEPLEAKARRQLGLALRARYKHSRSVEDIEEALIHHGSLLDATTEDSPSYSEVVCELGHTLFTKYDFNENGQVADLHNGVDLLGKGLDLMPSDSSHRLTTQLIFASALRARFKINGEVKDLKDAAKLHQACLELAPSHHRDRWMFIAGYSSCVGTLYEQTGELQYLEKSLELGRISIASQGAENPNRVLTAIIQSISLHSHFRRLGDINDIYESRNILRSCLHIDHPFHTTMLIQLSATHGALYDEIGTMDDLEEAIRLLRDVSLACPNGHEEQETLLTNLGELFLKQYSRDRQHKALLEAITLSRAGLALGEQTSGGGRVGHVLTHITALCRYHKDFTGSTELDEAINLCITHRSRTDYRNEDSRVHLLCMHADALMLRYRRDKEVQDMQEAIVLYETAIDKPTLGFVRRMEALSRLSDSLRQRHALNNNQGDLHRAISVLEEAQTSLPKGHPDRVSVLFKKAGLLLANAASKEQILHALQISKSAIHEISQSAQMRLSGALEVLKLAQAHQAPAWREQDVLRSLLDLCIPAIGLLPLVAYFGLDLGARLRTLGHSEQLASWAALYALLLQSPDLAVELLEEGRAVFWSQHFRLRTAFSSLPPVLATKLTEIAYQLDQSTFHSHIEQESVKDSVESVAAREKEAAKQRRLGEEFEALVVQARELPGMDQFLLPQRFSSLSMAAAEGPVVVFLSGAATVQVVVIPKPGAVYSIPLPNVRMNDLQALSTVMQHSLRYGRGQLANRGVRVHGEKSRRTEAVLADLWRKILSSVIEKLQLTQSEGRSRPRLTLCPTGIFTNLPLHAAGLYTSLIPEGTACMSAYCVPSYTPTLATLLNARRSATKISVKEASVLLAAVTRSPMRRQLPFAAKEVTLIQEVVPDCVRLDILSDTPSLDDQSTANLPTAPAILERLPHASILHLACHGQQDPLDPLESGFVVQGGMLTIAKLMSLNLDNAFLSYLSACDTAKGDEVQPDQAVHLAATMLFVGFKSVVGTMWSMDDFDGPVVARTVYEELFGAGADVIEPDAVPYALDSAVQKLRRMGLAANRWAPYVHFGV